MDIITRFWERQANRIVKYKATLEIAAAVGVVIAISTTNPGRPAGFIFGVFGVWCFSLSMVCELFYIDASGSSKIRDQAPILQIFASLFYVAFFGGLAIITAVLYVKING
jgi:hypothetical protein